MFCLYKWERGKADGTICLEGGSGGKRESEQTEEEVHLWVERENCGWRESGLSIRPTGKLALN